MQLLSGVSDLSRTGNLRAQLVALMVTAISLVVLACAFAAFPGFWPPMSPRLPADEVASVYRDHTSRIRFTMVTFNLFGVMLLPLYAVVVVQMKRMAAQSQAFAYCYLSAAVSGATTFALASIFFATAAFRPDRDADLIQLLNDLGWIVFVAPVGMVLTQNFMLALAIFHDDQPQPVLPRWVGHLSLMVAAIMAPSAFSVMFDSGPFAWDGAISFWTRNIAYGVFVVVLLLELRKSVHRQAVDEVLTQ